MRERPILMSAPMVRACLEGTKTQTRRVMKPQPVAEAGRFTFATTRRLPAGPLDVQRAGAELFALCPYGTAGDRLWVRENGWERPERTQKMMREGADTWAPYYYDADGETGEDLKVWGFKRRPSIHMPRWACRLVLEVVAVRVERLQEISEADAIAEGLEREGEGWKSYEMIMEGRHRGERHPHALVPNRSPTRSYRELWDSLNAARGFGWATNPWVWVVEFKPVKA